jgi:SAM-dependent methyltransferase
MLEQLRGRLDGREIDLHVGDIFNMPFEDSSFDGIASRWVLPHFPDWPRVIVEMGRKLRPGGYLFIDFCNAENVELSRRAGPIDVGSFGYCHDEADIANRGAFYAAASQAEMHIAATAAGLKLVEALPTGFFVNNAAIAAALGGEGYTAYKDVLKRHYMDPGARAFMEWFERFVSPRLPSPMVHGLCVVMRRPEA